MEILRRGKNIVDQAFIKIDQSINQSQLKNLEVGKVYGPDIKIKLIDQLSNPDPKLVKKYFGEIIDKKAADRFGTDKLDEYSYWSWRACGVADVMTVLNSYDLYKGSLYDLIKEIDAKNGYLHKDKWGRKDIGWRYAALKNAMTDKGLSVDIVTRLSTAHLLKEIANSKLAIVSIKSRNNSGTHLVVVSKFVWEGEENTPIFIHDPYNLDKKGGNKEVLLKDFEKNFLHRGMIVWRD